MEEIITPEDDKDEKEKNEKMDSNCITPGTKFMKKLREFLIAYIKKSILF